MSTIVNKDDVSDNLDNTPLDEDGAADQFLARFLAEEKDASKKKPSDKGKQEAEEASDETADDETENEAETTDDDNPSDEGDDEGSEETEETEEKAKKFVDLDDNTFVKIKVGDEELEVPLKDLTRVHGQEAALTRKSQEVADARKKADGEIAKSAATLDVMLKRAQERAAPFAQIDFLALTKNPDISAEDLTALRTQAQAAFDDVRFLEAELGNFMGHVQAQQKEERAKEAKACIAALSTPGTDAKPNPHFIEGWNQKVYDDIRSFATETGLASDVVNALVDPAAFKIIHMAMQFKKGASKVQTVKVNKTPKKIVKTSSSPVNTRSSHKAKDDKAMAHLRKEKSVDAAGEAFLARLTREVDE
jgi:hypothetical protein